MYKHGYFLRKYQLSYFSKTNDIIKSLAKPLPGNI